MDDIFDNSFENRLQKAKQMTDTNVEKIQRGLDLLKGEPYGNEVDGKSKTVWKLAKKEMLSYKAHMNAAIRGKNILVVQTDLEDSAYRAKIAEKRLNYVWNQIENRIAFKNKLIVTLGSEGNAIVRVGVKMKNGTPMPYAFVCKTEKIFVDPSVNTLDNADYIIYKTNETLEKIKQRKDYDKEAIENIEKYVSISNDDISSIYRSEQDSLSPETKNEISVYEYWYKNNGKIKFQIIAETSRTTIDDNSLDKTNEKKYFVLKEADSPFSFNKFPFINFVLYYEENGIYSSSIPNMIADEQKLVTGVVRGVIDNIAQANNGVHFIKKRALDRENKEALLNGDPLVEVNTMSNLRDVIYEGSFSPIPSSIFNIIGLIEGQSEALSGINKFAQGAVSSDELKAPAGNFNAMMSISQLKIEDMLENIEYGLNQMFLMFESIMQDFWNEQDIEKYTGIDINMLKQIEAEKLFAQYQVNTLPNAETRNKIKIYIIRKIEQMFNKKNPEIDLEFKISSQAKKNIKIGSILMLMQNVTNLVQGGIIDGYSLKLLSADLADALDRPIVANSIRNYKTQPNPMAQKMAEAELAEKAGKAQKEQALAANAMARTELTKVKAQTDAQSADVNVGQKYVDMAKTMKELGEQNANIQNKETSANESTKQ